MHLSNLKFRSVLLSASLVSCASKTASVNILPDISNQNSRGISGTVSFFQNDPNQAMQIQVLLTGLVPGSTHGMHIHGAPVQGQNCTLASSHWNPLNATHGAPQNSADKRHYGDLGNFQADSNGRISRMFTDQILSFYGAHPLTDKLALVFHEKQDDLGLGQGDRQAESLRTGNCGARLACGNVMLGSSYPFSPTVTSSYMIKSTTATTLYPTSSTSTSALSSITQSQSTTSSLLISTTTTTPQSSSYSAPTTLFTTSLIITSTSLPPTSTSTLIMTTSTYSQTSVVTSATYTDIVISSATGSFLDLSTNMVLSLISAFAFVYIL